MELNAPYEVCPQDALLTGAFRLGGHRLDTLYVVAEDGIEYYVGVLFRGRYGDPLLRRLNHGPHD
jgi:hypothetical protein